MVWYSQGVVYKGLIIPVGTNTKQPNQTPKRNTWSLVILWIFSSLVRWFLVIRQISAGIKMETEFITIMRVTPLFFFLQKECMEKCGVKPTMRGELDDKENDPRRHHHHIDPSLSPEAAGSACFMTWISVLGHSKLPDKEGGAPTLKGRICSSPCVWVCTNDFGLT